MSRDRQLSRWLEFDDVYIAGELFGPGDGNLKYLAGLTGADLETRGNKVMLFADDEGTLDLVEAVLLQGYGMISSGRRMGRRELDYAVRILKKDLASDLSEVFSDSVRVGPAKGVVAPKTLTQRDYMAAIKDNDIVFGIGPAGTGKTYLAVAMAVSALLEKRVKRIILTRPAVEAGEKLGFLPGDLVEKINPYLRPLYDALYDMLDFHKVQSMLADGVIEIAPLAFMRGRTLSDAFVILDEAQNTTPEQMKMFLTRLGFGSKGVVTGDATQIDLPTKVQSGLIQAHRILQKVKGIKFIRFDDVDVIRHPVVARIVKAYDRYENGSED